MAGFRAEKTRLLAVLERDDWYERIQEEAADTKAATGMISPLLAFLSRPDKRERAAWALGEAVAAVAEKNMEAARVILRRLMWSLNEESGNLGWGAPEAMGCILARTPSLAGEYGNILLSYVRDTGREDNFLDHAPLRAGVFRGLARLAETRPDIVGAKPIVLMAGLRDGDAQVRGMAALAVAAVAGRGLPEPLAGWGEVMELLRGLVGQKEERITWFDGRHERSAVPGELAGEVLRKIGNGRD